MVSTKVLRPDGGVLKNLIRFMTPTLLLSVVQALMNLTDMLVAANFSGVDVAAAVGIGGQLSYLIVTAVIGFSTGAAILLNKMFGAKDEGAFVDTINTYLTLSLIAAALVAMVFIPLAMPLLTLFATPQGAIKGASEYFVLQMASMGFVLLFQAINALFRGRGKSLPPLVFLSIGAIINIALDFLFLIPLRLGAIGISAATVVSQAAACLVGIFWIKKKKCFDFKKLRLKLCAGKVKELLKLGIPLAIENTAASVSFLILTGFVNRLGGENAVFALAAVSVGMRYNAFFMLPARATSMAISATVARYLGANKKDLIKKTVFCGMSISLVAGAVLTAISFFCADKMVQAFGAEQALLEYGVPFLKAFSVDYLILPISVALFGWLDGVGKTGYSMAVNIVSSFAIRIPLALVFAEVLNLGMVGIGLSIPLTSAVAAACMIIIVVVLKKKNKIYSHLVK